MLGSARFGIAAFAAPARFQPTTYA